MNNDIINKIPYMRCNTCKVIIKCGDLMEAEQRARIHMENTNDSPSGRHEAEWELR